MNSVSVFPLNIKLINPIQKYSYIIESYACILKRFAITSLLSEAEDKKRPINFIISLGTCSSPKLSKYVISLFLCTKQSNEYLYQNTHLDLFHMAHRLFY